MTNVAQVSLGFLEHFLSYVVPPIRISQHPENIGWERGPARYCFMGTISKYIPMLRLFCEMFLFPQSSQNTNCIKV